MAARLLVALAFVVSTATAASQGEPKHPLVAEATERAAGGHPAAVPVVRATARESVVGLNVSEALPAVARLAFEQSGVLERMSNATHTVFAPTNAAFARFLEPTNSTLDALLAHPDLGKLVEHTVTEGKFSSLELYEQALEMKDDGGEAHVYHASARGSSGVRDALRMLDGRDLEVAFASRCQPCVGVGAGPFPDSAAALEEIRTNDGVVFTVDAVVVPPYLCPTLGEDFKSWMCCGGCDGCECAEGKPPAQRFPVDMACKQWCAGEVDDYPPVAEPGAE